jgi:hypothetical protein
MVLPKIAHEADILSSSNRRLILLMRTELELSTPEYKYTICAIVED